MLVPDQIIKIKISNNNVKYYRDKGYDIPTKVSEWKNKGIIPDVGKEIDVKVTDLPINSHIKVDVKCDICEKTTSRNYQSYNKYHTYGYDCCISCSETKRKETSIIKYGVDHPHKSEDVVNKTIATNIEKYGGNAPSCSETVINKMKKTNLERYGVEFGLSLKEIQEKSEATFMKKYGVRRASQNLDVIKKHKQTMMSRYGVESPLQYKEFRDKAIKTTLLHCGVEYPIQSAKIKEKIKQTNIRKYGVSNYSKSDESKERNISRNLQKYGVKYIFQSPEIIEKIGLTLIKNNTCKTSKQQKEIHKMIQNRYPDAIINYSCDRSFFDIAILLDNNIKIDIEYDGWYWHQDYKRDMRRDMHHRSNGWKILRIKSAMKLPSTEELFDAIDYLINTDHHYNEIILDDWKKPNKEVLS